MQDLSPQLAKYFAVDAGVLVTQVNDGSPAARGGMKAGDVITRIDTTPVARASDITRALATVESGATVTIALMRDRAAQSLTVTARRAAHTYSSLCGASGGMSTASCAATICATARV